MLIEGELVYRQYERTIENNNGPVKVAVAGHGSRDRVIEDLDRQAKDKGAAA